MDFMFVNNSGTVFRSDPELRRIVPLADYALAFTDIAITRDGRVLANTFTALYELDLATGGATYLAALGNSANGLGTDTKGNLYVSGNTGNTITVLNDRTFAVKDTIELPPGVNSSGDILVRGNTLYYLASGAQVLTIDLKTEAVVDSATHGLPVAYGLHFSTGDLYAYSVASAYTLDPVTGASSIEGTGTFPGSIYGAAGVPGNVVRGTRGDDTLHCHFAGVAATGREGKDVIIGSYGRNVLYGDEGNDRIFGGGGDDALFGGPGKDRLRGQTGNDFLNGGRGPDQLSGGPGADFLLFEKGCGRDTVLDFTDNRDTLVFDDSLWGGRDLTRAQVVSRFAEVSRGDIVFDFGRGDQVILDGFDRKAALVDDLLIV